jgi:phasin family protein
LRKERFTHAVGSARGAPAIRWQEAAASLSEEANMAQNLEDVQKLGKERLDSAVKSMTAVSKGYQAIAAEMVDYTKKSFEDGSAAMEKLATAKSLDKLIELQSDYMKAAYEAAVARATKIGELYQELFKEAYKPFEASLGKLTPAK